MESPTACSVALLFCALLFTATDSWRQVDSLERSTNPTLLLIFPPAPVEFQQRHRNGTGQVLTLFCLQRDSRVTSTRDAPVTRRWRWLASNAPRDVDSNAFVPQQFGSIEIPSVYAEL